MPLCVQQACGSFMKRLKKILTLMIGLLPFTRLKPFFLNRLGHCVSKSARIGVNVLKIDKLEIEDGAWIGHFNIIQIDKLCIKRKGGIVRFNKLKGPFDVVLGPGASIGRKNSFVRAKNGYKFGKSIFTMDEKSNLVGNNFFDLTRSIKIGKGTVIGGVLGSFWTHGFYHSDNSFDRIRIDGEIVIGDFVYIGSSCLINPGVSIVSGAHIGSGATVSKSIESKGMYVSQALRRIDVTFEDVKSKLDLDGLDGATEVYLKRM